MSPPPGMLARQAAQARAARKRKHRAKNVTLSVYVSDPKGKANKAEGKTTRQRKTWRRYYGKKVRVFVGRPYMKENGGKKQLPLKIGIP